MSRALESLKLLREVTARKTNIIHNQSEWGRHEGDHPPEDGNYCGTIACVAGKFALSPEGKEMGIESRWVKRSDGTFCLQIGDSFAISDVAVHFQRRTGIPSNYLLNIFSATSSIRDSSPEDFQREAIKRIEQAILYVEQDEECQTQSKA